MNQTKYSRMINLSMYINIEIYLHTLILNIKISVLSFVFQEIKMFVKMCSVRAATVSASVCV